MLKKTKLLIGFSSSITALSSMVAPIGVSIANSNFANPYEQYLKFDDENGFNERWFNQFAESFENTIYSQIIFPSTKSQEWKDAQLKHLKQKIQLYKDRINELKEDYSTASMAYTVTSNAMIDDAYDSYVDDYGKHIKIYRSSQKNITFDDIVILFEQQRNSILTNMENAGIDPETVQFFIEDSNKQFDLMFGQLKQQYADPLAAMYKAKAKLATLFASANREIGFLGASHALAEFLSNHSIEFNVNKGDANCLDTLMNSEGKFDEETGKFVKFETGNDISLWMNDIFTIRNIVTGRPINFDRVKVIPGFKTYPVLKEIKIDKYTNEHQIDIDWHCVKDCYIGTEYETEATAHLYAPDAEVLTQRYEKCLADDNSTIKDMFSEEDDAIMMTYDIPLTNKAEVDNFKEVYLGKSNKLEVLGLRFGWDEASKCSFDPFVSGTIIDNSDESRNITVSVDAKGLAQSGLRVQAFGENNVESEWYRLDEILAPDGYEGCDEVTPTQRTFRNNEVDDEIAKSAISGFIENCSLKGICTLDKSFTKHDVNVELCAWYGNTKGENEDEREKTKISIGSFQLRDLPFTKVLYHDLTVRYNAIRSQVEQYANCSIVNPLYINLGDEKTSRIVSLTLNIALNSIATGLMFVPFLRPSTRIILGVYVVLTIADIAVAGTSYGIWENQIYKPVDELHSRVLTFSKTSLCQELMDEIIQDGKKFNLVSAKVNDNGIWEINKKEYDDNFDQNFKTSLGINYDGLIEFNKKYTSLDSFPKLDEFMDAVNEANINPYDVADAAGRGSDNSSYKKTVDILDLISTSITIANLVVTAIDIGIATYMAIKQWLAIRAVNKIKQAAREAASRAWKAKASYIQPLPETEKVVKPLPFVPTRLSTIDEVASESAKVFEKVKPTFTDAIQQQIWEAEQYTGRKITEDVAVEYTVKRLFIKDINPLATKGEAELAINFDKFLSPNIRKVKVNPRRIITRDGDKLRYLLHSGKLYEMGKTFLTLPNYRLVEIPAHLQNKIMFSQSFQQGAEYISQTIISTIRNNMGTFSELGQNTILDSFWQAVWKELSIASATRSSHSHGAALFTTVLNLQLKKTGKCISTMTYKELEWIFDKATNEMIKNIALGGKKMSLEGALAFNRAFSSGIRSIAMSSFLPSGANVVLRFV